GLAAGERLQVVTPAATITVLGTVFTVAHAAEATTVSVEEGRVQVRTSAGASRVLGAGEAFRSDAGSQPHPPPTDGWALLRHDREATTVLDHVRENGTLVLPADTQLVLEVEVPAGVRAITATLDGEELVMRSRTSDGRRVEKVPPYFLFGNQEDRHYARELEPGRRKLEVTGWADADATRVHDRAVFTLEIEPAAPAEATDRTTTTAPATPPARR
ncbi:MAG: FecR domain-containing protein, partial [Planctomycetota bacterium]